MRVRYPAAMLVCGVIGGLAVGAAATYITLRLHQPASSGAARVTNVPPSDTKNASEMAVTLSPDQITRANIKLATVESANAQTEVRIPGVVEPNAYQEVVVTPVSSGRVTRVSADLGQHVRRGDVLAELFSPELAEAQRVYLSAKAELEAHEEQLARTAKMVEVGVASRQELERAHAEHAMITSSLEGARSRLGLLGLTPDQIANLSSSSQMTSTRIVRAPIDGVVTSRAVNVGMTIEGNAPAFTVVNLSNVWVVGDVYEKDFSRVRVGDQATVTLVAYPDMALHGTISYIDPQVNRETRTAKVRVEVLNPRGDLRLGMYAEIAIASRSTSAVMVVPSAAVQTVGNRAVVYVSDSSTPGRFVERAVQTRPHDAKFVEVIAGLSPGDVVVSDGSFYVRAERERLQPANAAAGSPTVAAP